MDIQQTLTDGLVKLEISTPDAAAHLTVFLQQLQRWNRVYNLTAIKRLEDMVSHHIFDSLAILPWLQGPRIIDLGSGAGLPGIPLAIVRPQLRFFLLDSSSKRTRFLTQMVAELNLNNIKVIHSRVEEYHPEPLFDTITARAFAPLKRLLALGGHLCAPNGRLLLMKGVYPESELQTMPNNYQCIAVHALNVPNLNAERHLLHLTPSQTGHEAVS